MVSKKDIAVIFGLPQTTFEAVLNLHEYDTPVWELKCHAELKIPPAESTKTETLWVNFYSSCCESFHSEQEANENAGINRLYGKAYPVTVEK
jgi:hypothetical protein